MTQQLDIYSGPTTADRLAKLNARLRAIEGRWGFERQKYESIQTNSQTVPGTAGLYPIPTTTRRNIITVEVPEGASMWAFCAVDWTVANFNGNGGLNGVAALRNLFDPNDPAYGTGLYMTYVSHGLIRAGASYNYHSESGSMLDTSTGGGISDVNLPDPGGWAIQFTPSIGTQTYALDFSMSETSTGSPTLTVTRSELLLEIA